MRHVLNRWGGSLYVGSALVVCGLCVFMGAMTLSKALTETLGWTGSLGKMVCCVTPFVTLFLFADTIQRLHPAARGSVPGNAFAKKSDQP